MRKADRERSLKEGGGRMGYEKRRAGKREDKGARGDEGGGLRGARGEKREGWRRRRRRRRRTLRRGRRRRSRIIY